MQEILMIALDNSYYSQNQDYYPTRNIAQKKVIESLVYAHLQKSPENTAGFAPLAAPRYQICTPTNDIHCFLNQLTNIDLQDLRDPNQVIENCISAIHLKSCKRIFLLFVGSNMDVTESVINMINEGVDVYIAAFGDGSLFLKALSAKMEGNAYHATYIDSNKEFYVEVMNMFEQGGFEMEDDPELAMALRLSMQDK